LIDGGFVSLFVVLILFAVGVLAQPPLSSVRGELQDEGFTGGLRVHLRAAGGRLEAFDADVRGGGSFEFHNVPPGSYVLTVTSPRGEILREDPVEIGTGTFLQLRLGTERRPQSGPARTVTMSELRHPLSRKAQTALLKAKQQSDAGDHAAAVRVLGRAAKSMPGDAYVRTNLGVEYLRIGDVDAALPVLEEAARLMPDSGMTRGNLAYAYYVTHRCDDAVAEARAAVAADRGNEKLENLLRAALTCSPRQ
jgi:tetratricopeptide (TPR) repeat protein